MSDQDERKRSTGRLLVSGVFFLLVWSLYAVRLITGIGPMHDYEGAQAPALHYLFGALAVTAMVIVWNVVGAMLERNHRR